MLSLEINDVIYILLCLKMICLWPKLFTFYCLTILEQWILFSAIWETAKYSYPYMLKYYRKTMLKKCDPQIYLCLFMFRHITLNSLTSIDTLSCLGDLGVTHLTAVREFSGSITVSGMLCLLFWFLFVFFFQNTLVVMKSFNSILQC